MTDAPGTRAAGRSRPLQLVAVVVLTLLVPFSIRLSRVGSADAEARLPYLPVFPGQRAVAFHAHRLTELQHGNPAVVVETARAGSGEG